MSLTDDQWSLPSIWLEVKARLLELLLLANLSQSFPVRASIINPRINNGTPTPIGVSNGTINMKAKDSIIKKSPKVCLAIVFISLSFLTLAMKSI